MAAESILIIDDNLLNLKLARLTLLSAGYQVHAATDAAEAMAVLGEIRPHLILMDLQLPGVDGLELTRRLRADRAWHDVIIVALTASAMKGDDDRALAAGCDGYLSKPIEPPQLLAAIAEHLARGVAPR